MLPSDPSFSDLLLMPSGLRPYCGHCDCLVVSLTALLCLLNCPDCPAQVLQLQLWLHRSCHCRMPAHCRQPKQMRSCAHPPHAALRPGHSPADPRHPPPAQCSSAEVGPLLLWHVPLAVADWALTGLWLRADWAPATCGTACENMRRHVRTGQVSMGETGCGWRVLGGWERRQVLHRVCDLEFE